MNELARGRFRLIRVEALKHFLDGPVNFEMDPFECRATDGRSYILSGTGAADLQSMFVDMTFSAWLPEGQATLLCTTRYLQVSGVPDAGVAVPQLEMEPPPGGDGTPPVEEGLPPEGTVNSTEAPPAPGAAEMSGSG